MKLHLFKTLWGHEGNLESAAALAKIAGFAGIEAPVPENEAERQAFIAVLRKEDMDFIAEISTCTPAGVYVPDPGRSVEDHLRSLEAGINRSLAASPRFINTMAGSDAWRFNEARRFFAGVMDLEQKHGIAISCETHRGRSTYSPWLSRDLMVAMPDLKITCDFSHWCVVAERLVLDHEPDILALSARHAFHLHARVGYPQGPQVPDPRAPEYAEALAAHERWWEILWESMAERGIADCTLTPEFGPDGYLHCEPFSQKPVADLWEINTWIAERQRERFNSKYQLQEIRL